MAVCIIHPCCCKKLLQKNQLLIFILYSSIFIVHRRLTIKPKAQNMNINNNTISELALFAKALSHPARIEILKKLLTIDKCVCGQLVEILPLAQSTVSQHLKVLKEAGLVMGEIDGPKTCYCANRDKIEKMIHNLSTQLCQKKCNHKQIYPEYQVKKLLYPLR